MKMTGDEFRKKYVKNGKILPNNITEISTLLSLYSCAISKIENLPNIINGPLDLSYNNIIKIENLPNIITGSISFLSNKITKIENLPTEINNYIDLSNNNISKIENLPNIIHNPDIYFTTTEIIYLSGNKIIEYKKTDSLFQEIWFNECRYTRAKYLEFVRQHNVKETLRKLSLEE